MGESQRRPGGWGCCQHGLITLKIQRDRGIMASQWSNYLRISWFAPIFGAPNDQLFAGGLSISSYYMVLYDHHGVYWSADLESFWPNCPILPHGFNPSGAKLRSDEEDAASGKLDHRAADFPKEGFIAPDSPINGFLLTLVGHQLWIGLLSSNDGRVTAPIVSSVYVADVQRTAELVVEVQWHFICVVKAPG